MNTLTSIDSASPIASAGTFTLTATDRSNRKILAAANEIVFVITDEDHDEFQRLPQCVRNDVTRGLLVFEAVYNAKAQDRELEQQAVRFNGRRGWTFNSLRQKYFRFKASQGDWRVLVDYARVPRQGVTQEEGSANLPHDFVEYFKGLCQANKRVSEAAIRVLYLKWQRGESIPGYGTWQEWFQDTHPFYPLPEKCPPDYPVGWSRGNLRKYFPTDAELALARGGIADARTHLPSIMNSRVDVRPLEFVMFDDWKPDFKIVVPGFSSPVDLNLLVAIDVATGIVLRFGIRAAIPREDGVKDHLKLTDMKCLVAGTIQQFGTPRHYKMTFVVENATAAIKDGFAAALREVSCNQIEVSRTMMINGTALFGGYKDKAAGNPRGKGLLESTFNLAGNEAGAIEGQTGRRYDEGPADLHGRTRETEALLKTATLTPHQRVALRLPFLSFDQARIYIQDIFNRMNARTVHEMEGFNLVGEWRGQRFDQWRHETELLQLSVVDRESVEWRKRKESPVERWARLSALVGGKDAFQKIHPGALTRLFDEHRLVEVAAGEISFRFDKDSCVYRVSNAIGALAPIRDHQQFTAYFDAQDLSWIHLTDGKGGYVASIQRTRGVRRGDKAAMEVEMAEQRKRLHELQSRVSDRMPDIAERRLEDTKHNIEVLADSQAVELVPANDSTGDHEPAFSAQIGRVKFAENVRRRQQATADDAKATSAMDDIMSPVSGKSQSTDSGDFLSELNGQ